MASPKPCLPTIIIIIIPIIPIIQHLNCPPNPPLILAAPPLNLPLILVLAPLSNITFHHHHHPRPFFASISCFHLQSDGSRLCLPSAASEIPSGTPLAAGKLRCSLPLAAGKLWWLFRHLSLLQKKFVGPSQQKFLAAEEYRWPFQ